MNKKTPRPTPTLPVREGVRSQLAEPHVGSTISHKKETQSLQQPLSMANSLPHREGWGGSSIYEALCQEEQNRPPMPADLNARLMQRVEKEVNSKTERKRTRIVWPWIAAACVAGVIMMFLMPPKVSNANSDEVEIANAEKDLMQQQIEILQDEEPQTFVAKAETNNQPKIKTPTAIGTDKLFAKAEVQQEVPQEGQAEDAVDELFVNAEKELAEADKPAEPQPRMLTERDIPITRPENYKYTKEEIALMKKQANEAYLKWVELEIEISKYNLENTAENR